MCVTVARYRLGRRPARAVARGAFGRLGTLALLETLAPLRRCHYLLSRSSLIIPWSAAMTSSRSTRDLVNRSCSLNALVGAR